MLAKSPQERQFYESTMQCTSKRYAGGLCYCRCRSATLDAEARAHGKCKTCRVWCRLDCALSRACCDDCTASRDGARRLNYGCSGGGLMKMM